VRARAPAPDRLKSLSPDESNQRPELDASDNNRPSHLLRRPLAFGLLALVVATTGGYLYWDNSRRFASTDDAFIAARSFPVASKVSGYITAVPVSDNQHVVAGDVIAQIDDRDYRVALDQAQAQVNNAAASIENIDALASVQEAQISVNQAQVEQAKAALTFAEQQAQRYQVLADKGSGTVETAQQYASQLRQQQAALAAAESTIKLPQRQVWALKKQHNSAVANLAQVTAQRDQAQLNLSYTTVKAAQSGRVVNLTAAVGQFAQSGTNLAMFVPDAIWVTANFKETQLDSMRPGQPVTVAIDAYPERAIKGHVASIQPGSGTAFSLLPAENATGNYVKIVQRVPVKIILEDPPLDVALGPGMSVVPRVRVNPDPSLYERLRSWL
jgi:membrane fusion protein, multidrug efflux system